jgi:uncharacterized protein YlzI (FlbEa/FlbD family)
MDTAAEEHVPMKRHALMYTLALPLAAAVLVAGSALADVKFSKSDCSFNGKRMYGKIQVVTAFPDVKVEVVSAFPDVKVQKVDVFADKCGKWQMVNAFPDTKVQFVTAFPDVTIQYVTAFPGVP